MRLPIEDLLPEIQHVLGAGSSLVLQAPPGAGKTTRVPLALLGEKWLRDSRVVMLEPRRLAARAAAGHMASLLNEQVGQSIGYRIRNDTRVGPDTRIEVVTEGVLTRMLQHDPALDGIGLLIFDEFHERSLHADLGLALALHSRALIRPDLRVLVMSATLDTVNVAQLLGDAPTLSTPGIAFPVETRFFDTPRTARIEDATANAVARALEDALGGDVLVFLPGAAEIARTAERIASMSLAGNIDLLPLYANLSREEQQRAILPAPPGRRKIVLATSIAETSLTIEGVNIVIDSGWMRVPRFSPRTGMTRLETIRVTRDAADQRRGRAGRTAPGICYRLWSMHEEAGFVPRRTPEILEADLAPLALELAAWRVQPAELKWLDPPPLAAYAQARELLTELGALDAHGTVTPHGRKMTELPAHPRIAHLLLRAAELRTLPQACDLAALLDERDVLRQPADARDPDVRVRLDLVRSHPPRFARNPQVDRAALAAVRAQSRDWQRRLRFRPDENTDDVNSGVLLAFAYPDRIARKRPGSQDRYLLRNGHGVRVTSGALLGADWIVAAQLGGTARESTVWLGAPIQENDLVRFFADQVESESEIAWDAGALAVRARRRDRLGAIRWNEGPLHRPDPDRVAAALFEGIRSGGLTWLAFDQDASRVRERIQFLHHHDPQWPDMSDAALLDSLENWLLPYVLGRNSISDLRSVDFTAAWLGRLSPQQRARLDLLAPSHLAVPSGSRIAIDYADPAAPALAVRLQEVFGLLETPRIAGGQVPLTMRLLSPAMRPVQVTRDLASFWRTGYFDVRRDLRARYPKHAWPDDPLHAEPTRRARPRHRS